MPVFGLNWRRAASLLRLASAVSALSRLRRPMRRTLRQADRRAYSAGGRSSVTVKRLDDELLMAVLR